MANLRTNRGSELKDTVVLFKTRLDAVNKRDELEDKIAEFNAKVVKSIQECIGPVGKRFGGFHVNIKDDCTEVGFMIIRGRGMKRVTININYPKISLILQSEKDFQAFIDSIKVDIRWMRKVLTRNFKTKTEYVGPQVSICTMTKTRYFK